MTIVEALQRLRDYPATLLSLTLATAVDAPRELAALLDAVARLQQQQSQGLRRFAEPIGIERARGHWLSVGRDLRHLNRREIRILCWDEQTALQPDFIAALTHHAEFKQKRIWIEGIISAYFGAWRSMEAPAAVEQLLRIAVRSYRGESPWLGRCRDHAGRIFSPDAATFLAQQSLADSQHLETTLDQWNVGRSAGLGPASANAAIEEWISGFLLLGGRDTEALVMEQLRYFVERLLPFPTIKPEVFGAALGEVILSGAANEWSGVQEFVKKSVLKDARLGDPRLPVNAARWNAVSPEGRRRFVSWLARDDLLFFFDFVIPDRNDPHDRKRFWLQYLDYVEDSRVALCSTDRSRLRSQALDKLSHSRITDSTEVSAFLMRFRGSREEIIVVEFSRPGNAIYIHSAVEFARALGNLRQSEFRVSSHRGLKQESRLEKFIHKQPNNRWQREVRDYLATLGIRLK